MLESADLFKLSEQLVFLVHQCSCSAIIKAVGGDGLSDGDEIALGLDPLNPDSDGDGIPDNEEKIKQTFIHDVENECAVEQIIIDSAATGNLQNTMTINSIMNVDILCTEVVGLIGEPFEIETTSEFDSADITFKIDKSKLNGTSFDDLLFLWYDEENDIFMEMDTIVCISKR